ncbi:hypothetical protein HGO23_01060 [Xenorhabdus budapestensis]|uniref:Uncharacterized protein n=1 Tax=Xenorhabdus budapestensis TaxID=290110 RepID=A0ABX7VHI2_XENBU|nr:hypothetical protein HGO23_01060 [Xenorhabdus budapestensis]
MDFTLNESFSQPFNLNVGLASADPAIDFPTVLDRTATLTILQDGVEQRSITGVVSYFEQGNTVFGITSGIRNCNKYKIGSFIF